MKIKTLTLENFRAFSSFRCDFSPGVNVLIGLNGFGKTAVLDAIAIAYGQFVGGFETGADRGIQDHDIRLQKHTLGSGELEAGEVNAASGHFTMERQFPVLIKAHTHSSNELSFPESWSRKRNMLKGRTTQVKALKTAAHKLQKSVQDNQPVTLPLFSYYGTGRLWKVKRLTEGKDPTNKPASRLDGYQDCLSPESTYSAFAQWLRRETIADFERRMQLIEQAGLEDAHINGATVRSKLLGAIRQAVDTVLQTSGWHNVRYSANEKEVVAHHPEQGVVPVSSLSDGVRNMIGMVADIAYRAVRLNPQLLENAVRKTSGLVFGFSVDRRSRYAPASSVAAANYQKSD
jgi:predicted ATP-binding protein involved in virulence